MTMTRATAMLLPLLLATAVAAADDKPRPDPSPGTVTLPLSEFDRLLSRYPSGPLAESASVERMRLLKTVAPERATASAREYLARYPTGFARTEAESLVQAGVPAGP